MIESRVLKQGDAVCWHNHKLMLIYVVVYAEPPIHHQWYGRVQRMELWDRFDGYAIRGYFAVEEDATGIACVETKGIMLESTYPKELLHANLNWRPTVSSHARSGCAETAQSTY